MGWIDKFKRKPKVNTVYADMLNGYTPIFSQFGQNIYASDVVQQAIMCIVSELKKLAPTHVMSDGADVTSVKGNVQNILNNPNELMTTSEFIEKFVWNLFFNYNSFIIPTFTSYIDGNGVEQRNYNGLYPVQPTNVEFEQDSAGKLYVKMTFANGYETTLPYDDVIHIRYKYSVGDYMGGNESGQPDNEALLETLQINKDLLKGVSSAMKSSFAINGVVKINTMLDDGKTEKALKELEDKLRKSESGFLPLDLKSEFIPITHDIQLVDADTLKFIDEKILRHFGVPLCILLGDYTKEQYEAFYQKTLEPIIKSISEAFTKTLFTPRMRSFGNKIVFYPKDLIFMSVSQTLEMVRLLGDSGALYENEKRVAFGLRPLSELNGVRMQSLNYVNVDIAKNYQTGGTKDEKNNL
jgi:HK97 family phage portal protein